MSVRLRPEAESDIDAIVAYIAADNPAAASRWVEDIYMRLYRLAEMPGMGVARSEVRPSLRMLPVGNYLILYQELDDGDVEIVRVVHGARQWQELLS